MRKCCGCSGGAASEPAEAHPLDLGLLEAKEKAIKIGFRAPRAGSKFLGRGARPRLEFTVTVMGGPYSDVLAPRVERIPNIACGSKVLYEIAGLHPDTEYSLRVALVEPSSSASSSSAAAALPEVAETLEVRTTDATTALFAGEDWGRMHGSSDGKGSFKQGDYMKAPDDQKGGGAKVPGGGPQAYSNGYPGASSSSSAAAAVGSASAAAAAAQDELSTNAPSDAGDETARRFDDNGSESGGSEYFQEPPLTERGPLPPEDTGVPAAGVSAAAPAAADIGPESIPVVDEVEVLEVKQGSRTMECKLCSILDCLRTSRNKKGDGARMDEHDLVLGPNGRVSETRTAQSSSAAPSSSARSGSTGARSAFGRRFRPYRAPFPGTPVDPASVGLLPRDDLV